MMDTIIIAVIGFIIIGGIYLYSNDKRKNIREYMTSKGIYSEKPGQQARRYDLLSKESQKQVDSFIDEIIKQSNTFGIDSYVLASLIMTESMGNLHAMGDFATDFLGPRSTSFGPGQISSYKAQEDQRSSFDSYVINNLSQDIAFLLTNADRTEYLISIRDGKAEPFTGVFSSYQGAKIPAYWLSLCLKKAREMQLSGKVSVLAGLFKYKNGQNAPTPEILEKLKKEYTDPVEWFYKAGIEHGDFAKDPYMDRYDDFVKYFDRFNSHYMALSGKPFMTMEELKVIEK